MNNLHLGIDSLNGAEMLSLISNYLLPKLKDQLEEAKLRCADEEDDISLGEYISLKSVVEQIEKYFLSVTKSRLTQEDIDRMRGISATYATQYATQTNHLVQYYSQYTPYASTDLFNKLNGKF